ncbi:MAG: radical SAM protein [Eubacterium sp.]|nr:radical SAM protein [Eubacterium sp.]
MKSFEELITKEENNKMVLLNPNNLHWVKMKKALYDKKCSSSEEEEQLINYLDEKYDLFQGKRTHVEEANIKSIYFSITNKCNMSCPFCSMNSGPDVSRKKDLSLKEIRKIVIPKIKKINPRKIVVSGGEPLVREDIKEILQMFSESFGKERVVLQTNGLLMNDDILGNIKDYISGIEFSVEYIFDNEALLKRMENIFKSVISNDLVLAFSFVIDEDTRRNLIKAIDLGHKYDAIFTMRVVSQVGRAAEQSNDKYKYGSDFILDTYYEVAKHIVENRYFNENISSVFLNEIHPKRHCGAYGNVISIRPNGDTRMCSNFKDLKFSMGSIIENSAEDIMNKLNQKLQDEEFVEFFCVDAKKMCKDCEIKYFCSGPCAAEIAENSENIDEIEEKCVSRRILTKYSMFYYDKKESDEINLKNFLTYIEAVR